MADVSAHDDFSATSVPGFLTDGGECADLIAAKDWATTSLGPIARWPQSLRTAIAILLRSPVPIVMLWGEDGVMLYNDAYSLFAGGRHPELLGSRVREGWPEVADFNDNVMKVGLAGDTLHYQDQELTLYRHGRPERVWMDLDYSPVLDERGEPAGVICILAETTERVAAERRTAFLLSLSDALRALDTPLAITSLASARLGDWLDASRVFYAEIASGRMTVESDHARGVPSIVGEHSLQAFGPDLLGAYRAGEPVVVRDVAADERLSDDARAGLTDRHVGAFVDVVLFEEKEWVGLLAVQSATPRVWTSAEESLVQEVGERVKTAVERARAEVAVRESEARHRFRVQLGDELRTLTSSSAIMMAVARRLGAHLGVDQANYYDIDGDHFTVTGEWRTAASSSMLGTHSVSAYGAGTTDRMRRGEILRLDKTHDVEGLEAYAAAGMAAVLSVPLRRDDRWAAGLHVHQTRPRVWTDEEEALVREVAAHAWSAIERARAEEELRDLNDTLEEQVAARSAERDRLWTLSQDMFARADYSGMMSAVSPAWMQVLGWTEAELLSRGYATFMHPDDMPGTLAAIARMANTRRPTRFENRIATSDGGWKPIEWIVAPEPDGDNFIAVGRDLSDAKAREDALGAAQEALRQSQKMEAMGSLTGGVAHDFNNLLTPIIGSLDMLVRKGIGSERERRLIGGALQSAERAKTLVQRLLAFARRQPLQPTAVDVARIVDGMAGLIGSTLGPTIDVRVDLAADLPPARADLNQLEMALLNLAVNARDAMPDGGELTITARRESVRGRGDLPRGHYVRLSVGDSGVGMDADTVGRAVEPFFSTKGVGKGTGLGLSMVHGLVAQLGGGLTIDSAPGRGTTIGLWLPISAVAPDGEERPVETTPAVKGRGTALLIDDEDLVRMSTADMLADLNYDVVEAGSAEEALRLIGDGLEPDLLVTDHLMPGMSGAQLARELKVARPELPVLIVSGYAEEDGIDPDIPRLTKPFRNAELAASLSTLTKGA
ncbi:PAS domain S-box protein [Sphingomonas sp. KR1UV-12]|uniref:histidine kinase n=1 Tax=Sphingomonas aurea TaxID=3063994 RepID=A0ABT9EN61_9SPHN|nr:GAF domain-containing protein [Sphingomonas sp. KR1UV-12]MDP1028397.1 PAS domain S-box protein [Sphingomonas sp. KR1UV-12]